MTSSQTSPLHVASRDDAIRSDGNRGWLKPAVVIGTITMLMPLLATAVISGKSSAEKLITNMVQPIFLAIVAALWIGAMLVRRGEKGMGWLLFVGAIAFWCLSSQIVVNRIVAFWESRIKSSLPFTAEPFDYIVVLGGGTSVSPDGRAQFGGAGDRVGLAARLYLAGKARNLVTTGDVIATSGSIAGKFETNDDPSDQTKQIWHDLGIPDEVLFELSGQNTYSEIASLKKHPEWWQNKRCGLLTSASHMPRAMALAERAGVHVIPISANYISSKGPFFVNHLMPDVHNLGQLQLIIKEWIGMSLQR